MNVWLELEAAEAHGNVNTDIFQVSLVASQTFDIELV